jgi:hypothetical protein
LLFDGICLSGSSPGIGEKNTKYATVGDMLKLPAGTYSVYIIAWGKRELMMKRGNLTEYFAKTVLTVK